LVATDQIRQRSQVRNLRYLQAVGAIKENVALSHLWIEEYVTGDIVDINDIYHPLGQSRSLIRTLCGDQDASPPPSPLSPLPTGDLLREALILSSHLEEFRRISEERQTGFEQGLDMSIGSKMDVRYDAVFAGLLSSATRLEEALEEYMTEDRRRALWVLLGILLTWTAIVIGSAIALKSLERRRGLAEAALRQSQTQLMQSQKMEAVGRLAGGLAHDINNYLAALRGHCELVRMKHPEKEWIVGKMGSAIRIAEKASSLLERLQTFRKKQPLRLEVLSLNPVVQGVLKVLAPALRDDVQKRLVLAPDLWNVEIDATHLEQLLVNLILNAQEAMERDGTLTLTTRNRPGQSQSQDRVEVSVEDTGAGITTEIRDRLFEPFFTTKQDDRRHGLGLAIVYTIVEQSGGTIQVDSEVGKGTTFRVLFPRSTQPATVTELMDEIPEKALQGHEHVLLIDDNDDFRQTTEELLNAYGFQVSSCASGEEALNRFPRIDDSLDVVVSDVVMPGLSGPATVERLRQQRSDQRPLKALFVSAYAEGVTTRHGVHEGEDRFLRKTAPGRQLVAAVRALLDDSPTED